jgi:GNAT superfamily N-acetyltransferase
MARVDVQPFTDDDLDAAGALLARRHAAHRSATPLLAERFEKVEEATREVAELWKVDGASGAVGRRAGRVVGYLLGTPRAGDLWGPNVWVEPAGHAVEDAETVRDLYAVAAARWVDEGRTAHYTVVPAPDAALVDAWFRLGFGQQHVHGLCDAALVEGAAPADVTVRRATRDDIPALASLDLVLPRHQALSPVFSSGGIPPLDESLAEWTEDIDDPAYTTFVAERDGVVVGSAVGCSVEKSRLHSGIARPDDAGFLGFAAVRPDARGHGVGTALGRAVMGWIAEAGYRAAVTDWRATNLLSSRTWPRLGFRPSFLRLHRVVGY